jgi:hypothetical protein
MVFDVPKRVNLGNAYTVVAKPTVYDVVTDSWIPWTGATTIRAGFFASEVTPPTNPLVEVTLVEAAAGTYRADFAGASLANTMTTLVGEFVYLTIYSGQEFARSFRVAVVNNSTQVS